MSYDVLLVGCGIGAATIAALLKSRYKILALDTRTHLGGNCYDYPTNNTYVHLYGPHIFHTNNKQIEAFVKSHSSWIPYNHQVQAEIHYNQHLRRLPFPYSKETESVLGESLTETQVIDLFFKDYSKKMWGKDWDCLPTAVKARVPKCLEKSEYFHGEFCGLPESGFTPMIHNMFAGVDILLGIAPDLWKTIPAKHIIYCGRVDTILQGERLKYRNLKIEHKIEQSNETIAVTNYCHGHVAHTRRTNYNILYNQRREQEFVSYEIPCEVTDEVAPFYPSGELEEIVKAKQIMQDVKAIYPNIRFLGRLGTYKYLNMDQVIGQAMALAETL